MKDIHRSRRFRLPRRRYQLNKPLTSSDDDDDDDNEIDLQQKIIAQSNKNANRTATTIFQTISKSTMEPKAIGSDPSSLFLYSIHSGQKPAVSHSDLTPLTRTATNTTSLTVLPHSDTKMTESEVVRIDLTDLSESDIFDSSSPTNSDHKISQMNTDHQITTLQDLTHIDETDMSVKSIIFAKENLFDHERTHPQHHSCVTIPNRENEHRTINPSPIIQINETKSHQSSIGWNLRNLTVKMKLLIGCSSLSLIAGILILVFIL